MTTPIEIYKNLKVANYNRKSQDSEDKQVLSIPSQREEAEKLRHSLKIQDMVPYEDTKSALAPGLRTQFTNMIQDLRAGRRDSILCWKLDRLARNMYEGGEIIDLLQRGIIKAIITPQKVYLPSENALLMAVEFGSANQFSRDLSVNVKRGQTKKAKMGIPHGVAAIGFLNDKTEEKGNRKWLVDEIRLPIVKKLLELFLTGQYSGAQMYELAVKISLTTPKHKRIGGKLISRSRIYEILKDSTYAGFFSYQGERYELDKDLPRLITEEEHYRIIRILSGRNSPKTQTHQSAYTGFITSPAKEFIGADFKYQVICECKHKFSYANKTHCPKCRKEIGSINNPKYLEYELYYNVPQKKKKQPVKYISQKEITKFLTEFTEYFTLSPALAEWSRRHVHELHDNEVEINLVFAESQKQRLEQLEKQKERYRHLLAEELIDKQEYEHDISKIKADAEKINKNSQNQVNWLQEAETIIDLGSEMKKILLNGSIKAKREILSKLGSNLTWDEENLSISNRKPIQILIDGLIEAKRKNPQFEPENIVDTSSQNEVFEDVRPIMLPR